MQRGDAEGVTTLGWEVSGPAELVEFAKILESAGYDVTEESADVARDRGAMGVISFTDPDGLRVELFYGQKIDKRKFVSPTGASFVTGEGGLGHVFQLVNDEEKFRQLYLELLGFKLSDYIEFGPIFGTFTHCNPRHHSFAFAAVPNAPKGIGHIMFEVDDIDSVGRAYDKVVKENAAPLAMPPRSLPIDPYVLGVWLGDGTTSNGSITSADEGVIEEVRRRGHTAHLTTTRYLYRVDGLTTLLRTTGFLNHKHVPDEYLLSSREQRMDLLRGLHVKYEPGQVYFDIDKADVPVHLLERGIVIA